MFMSSTQGVIKLAGDLEFETAVWDDEGEVFTAGVGYAPGAGNIGGTWVKDTISGISFVDFNYTYFVRQNINILTITVDAAVEQDAWTEITWDYGNAGGGTSTASVLSANATAFTTAANFTGWLFQVTGNVGWGMDIYNTETLYPVVT